MKRLMTVGLLYALAMTCGTAAAARSQQGGSSSPAHPSASPSAPVAGPAASPAAGESSQGVLNADTPEDDAALNLTDAQKAQIKTIREDAKQQVEAAEKDTSLSEDAQRRKLRVIRKETRVQVWGVMTPDQQKQWATEQRERRESKHEGTTAPEGKPQT